MAFSPSQLPAQLPLTGDTQRLWVAFSGGLDSTVLLHSLVQLALSQPILALHINHRLSPHADDWERRCARYCEALGVPFRAQRVQVETDGKGLENAAREARYGAFKTYLEAGDLLLTGHHADDQAETLLLRLLRGSGPGGLAAMARQRPLGSGTLVRPLLTVERRELLVYAQQERLTWIDDESNADPHFDRNYLRQTVLPALAARWPGFSRQWQASADLCAESEQLQEDLARQDLGAAQPRPEWGGWSLDLSAAATFHSARRRNLVRYWLRRMGLVAPSRVQLEQIDTQLLAGEPKADARVTWCARWELRRFRQRLYLLHPDEVPEVSALPASVPVVSDGGLTRVSLPQGGVLDFCPQASATTARLRADLPDLHVRWRRGGERCRPSHRTHSQSLKKLLQEAGLEPWWRARVPLVYSGEHLVAVGDLWVCEGFVAGPDQSGWRLRWQRQTGVGSASGASFD